MGSLHVTLLDSPCPGLILEAPPSPCTGTTVLTIASGYYIGQCSSEESIQSCSRHSYRLIKAVPSSWAHSLFQTPLKSDVDKRQILTNMVWAKWHTPLSGLAHENLSWNPPPSLSPFTSWTVRTPRTQRAEPQNGSCLGPWIISSKYSHWILYEQKTNTYLLIPWDSGFIVTEATQFSPINTISWLNLGTSTWSYYLYEHSSEPVQKCLCYPELDHLISL